MSILRIAFYSVLPYCAAHDMSLATASQPYKDALTLQRVLMKDAESMETPPAVKAQIARAWKELECLKRVMRGKPANTSQSIKQESPRTAKSTTSGPLEPIPEEKPEQ